MSLEDIKKKSKLSLDEMIDNKNVGNPGSQNNGHPYSREPNNPNYLPSNLENEKYNCKVTFNIPERLLDQFNEIYAKGIIDKRKINKSVLFCEALEQFIKSRKK